MSDEFRLVRVYERRHHGGYLEQVTEYSNGTFGGSCAVPSPAPPLANPLSTVGVGHKAYPTREDAVHAAGIQLRDTGHVCDERCDGHWSTRHPSQQP